MVSCQSEMQWLAKKRYNSTSYLSTPELSVPFGGLVSRVRVVQGQKEKNSERTVLNPVNTLGRWTHHHSSDVLISGIQYATAGKKILFLAKARRLL